MAPTNLTHGTLLDMARRKDPNGQAAVIAEVLTRKNALLEDMIWKPTNKDMSHSVTIRSGLPNPELLRFYKGMTPSKSKTTQVTETCSQYGTLLEVDKEEAEVNGMSSEWFMTEADAHMEAMQRALSTQVLYGTKDNVDGIVGLTPRFATPSTDMDLSGYNIIPGAGDTASVNTSVWFLKHDPANLFGLYPKNKTAGIDVGAIEEVWLTDSAGGQFKGLRQQYKWWFGLCVKNWKNVARVCNIEVADLIAGNNTQANQALIYQLIRASERFDNTDGLVMYCNRTVRTVLRRMILEKAAGNLSFETVAGKRVIVFDGIPVKLMDSITNTEELVTGTFASA